MVNKNTNEIQDIEIKDIIFLENSRLKDNDDVSSLMEDIKQNGLLHPIGLRAEDNVIIYGNRRLAACKKLGHKTIKAIFYSKVDDTQLLVMNLVENLNRRDLNSIEIGRVCLMLREKNLTDLEISKRIAVPEKRVKATIKAYEITKGTPFEKLVVFKQKFGRQEDGLIPEALIWRVYTTLNKWKITDSDWNTLLKAMKEGRLNLSNIMVLRNLKQADGKLSIKQCLEALESAKVCNVFFNLNLKEAIKLMKVYKVDTESQLLKQIIREAHPEILF